MDLKNILKLSTKKGQDVIPNINSELKEKFLAPTSDLDLLNRTDPRNKYFQNKEGKLLTPKECIQRKQIIVDNIDFLQRRLFAQKKYSVLLIFQGLDAAGKDGCIFRVLKGINPAGCQIVGFQQPSKTELLHDFLWRTTKELPEKGKIGVFNRSYYEDVLVTKVHPEILKKQGYDNVDEKFWESRYESIRNFEKHLADNGVLILKFFLNVSKKQQAYRLWRRLKNKEMTWKFSKTDLVERQYWDNYMSVFSDAITQTNRPHAPWFIIPADNKHYLRMSVAEILESALNNLDIPQPELQSGINDEIIQKGIEQLEKELNGVPIYYKKTYGILFKGDDEIEKDERSEVRYPLTDQQTKDLEEIFRENTTDFLNKKEFYKNFSITDVLKEKFNKYEKINLGEFLKLIAEFQIADDIIRRKRQEL